MKKILQNQKKKILATWIGTFTDNDCNITTSRGQIVDLSKFTHFCASTMGRERAGNLQSCVRFEDRAIAWGNDLNHDTQALGNGHKRTKTTTNVRK